MKQTITRIHLQSGIVSRPFCKMIYGPLRKTSNGGEKIVKSTLPKTKIAPEKLPSLKGKYLYSYKHHVSGASCSTSGV